MADALFVCFLEAEFFICVSAALQILCAVAGIICHSSAQNALSTSVSSNFPHVVLFEECFFCPLTYLMNTCLIPRPFGIDLLNVAVNRVLADGSQTLNRLVAAGMMAVGSVFDAKLHVTISSVIGYNELTGETIV